jgi:anti-sigma B factor antagonist
VSFSVRSVPAVEQTVVEVQGEVDIDTAPRMRRALVDAADRGVPVLVDLGAVTFMDSAGFGVLVAAQRDVAAAGTTMRLRGVSGRIRQLLALLGLDAVFTVDPEEPIEVA